MLMIADVGTGVLILLFIVYWLPTGVAISRHHHNVASIIVINLLLGWTFIGWVIALAMSVSAIRPSTL